LSGREADEVPTYTSVPVGFHTSPGFKNVNETDLYSRAQLVDPPLPVRNWRKHPDIENQVADPGAGPPDIELQYFTLVWAQG
jgi:hypothetical protein